MIVKNDETAAAAKFIHNNKEMKRLNAFNPHKTKEDTVNQTCLYTLYDNYAILESPRKDIQKILKKLSRKSFTDRSVGKTFYIVTESKYESTEWHNQLKGYPVNVTYGYRITPKSRIEAKPYNRTIKTEKFSDKILYLLQYLVSHEITPYPHRRNPRFYLLFDNDTGEFVQNYSGIKRVSDLFTRLIIPNLLLWETGLIRQKAACSIQISASALREIVPARFALKDLENYYSDDKITCIKDGSYYTFEFSKEAMEKKHENYIKTHWVALPVKYFLNVFHQKGLSQNLPFLLTTLSGYNNRTHITNLSAWKWIKYANINMTRGTANACQYYNKRMEFLKSIGLVCEFEEMTKETIRYNEPLRVTLKPKYLL